MEIVLASNFDDRLVDATASLPIATFFGGPRSPITGGGRPPGILPAVDDDRLRAHVAAVHRRGRTFFATLNSSDLGLREYTPGYLARLDREVGRLLDLGVDGFVAAVPAVFEAIHRAHPSVPIAVSTFARIRSVAQAEYYRALGGSTIILEEANRDFRLIRGLVRRGFEVEILVNQSCLPSCPYRGHHLNTSSLASQPGAPPPSFEYPILQCGLEYVRDPAKLIAGIFVRPEDLAVYEAAGVHRFKISGRNRSTDWLAATAAAYAARRHPGDLADLLSLVQLRGPRAALARLGDDEGGTVATLRAAFEPLARLSIDNTAFPPDFLAHIAAVDCASTSCAACGYCRRVAEKVVRVDGRPLADYRPPTALPSPLPLLARLGVPASPSGADPGPAPAGEPAASGAALPTPK